MPLDIALKEWAIVCDLLAAGRCCLLLRKGGIHERGGPGRFALDHDRFLMFPAWEHERLDWIKPDWLPKDLSVDEPNRTEPSEIAFKCYAQTARVWQIPCRDAFDRLDDLHPWAGPQIDMRFNYKPDRPLYLMALRVYALADSVRVPNRESFGGCVSWVPLAPGDEVDVQGAQPAIDSGEFDSVIARVDQALAV